MGTSWGKPPWLFHSKQNGTINEHLLSLHRISRTSGVESVTFSSIASEMVGWYEKVYSGVRLSSAPKLLGSLSESCWAICLKFFHLQIGLYWTGHLVRETQCKLSWDLSGYVNRSSTRSRASGMSVLNVNRIPFFHLFSMLLLSYQIGFLHWAGIIVDSSHAPQLTSSLFPVENLQDNVVG